MSSEHFVFKNKLCFYLYQHHFHCLISGRQRQKDGNSERKKLRAELILKWNKVCYFNAAEEHFLWITTTWLIFFTVFWQNAHFWREKKKKNSKHYPASCLVKCHLTDCAAKSLQATVSLESRSRQLNPAAAPVPGLGEPWHSMLAAWLGSCSFPPDNRFLQRRMVLELLPPSGSVSTV